VAGCVQGKQTLSSTIEASKFFSFIDFFSEKISSVARIGYYFTEEIKCPSSCTVIFCPYRLIWVISCKIGTKNVSVSSAWSRSQSYDSWIYKYNYNANVGQRCSRLKLFHKRKHIFSPTARYAISCVLNFYNAGYKKILYE
jgi:hypothetical protein